MDRVITKITGILAAASLLAGCTEKYPAPDHFVGVIAGDFTRTSYTPDGNMLKGSWNEGDVMFVNGNMCIAAGTGEKTDFYVVDDYSATAAPFTAWYPAEIARMELPMVQTYRASGPFEVPMMAESPTMYLEFKPICGLMEIRLSTILEGIEVKTLDVVADKALYGPFRIDNEGNAVLSGPAENGIQLDCGEGVALGTEPVSFWLTLPPGEYRRLDIRMTATDGRTQEFSLQKGTMAPVLRGRITTCPIEMQSILTEESDIAYLPVGQVFNIKLKQIAHPDLPANSFETAVTDSTIRRIDFVTDDPQASGTPLGGSDIPVYASFDPESGVMTVATTARRLHTATDCCCMFRYMAALESVSFANLETEGMADASYMFNNCHDLKTIDFTGIRTGEVRTMDNMFSYCLKLEVPDLTKLDTRSVCNMRSLFNHCSSFKNLDLRTFKTEQCTIMTYMFYYCSKLETIDLTSFDLQNVPGANLNYHFFAASALREVRTSETYLPKDGALPSSYCSNSTTSLSLRVGKNGGLTFYTTQAVADWLATTDLRWIHSGYSGKTAIPVHFIDSATNAELSVTWAAD